MSFAESEKLYCRRRLLLQRRLHHDRSVGVARRRGEGSGDAEQGAAEEVGIISPKGVWNEVDGHEGQDEARPRDERTIGAVAYESQSAGRGENRREQKIERRDQPRRAERP